MNIVDIASDKILLESVGNSVDENACSYFF